MYKRESKGLLKHRDFVLIDLICLQISFIIAYILFNKTSVVNPYDSSQYRIIAVLITFVSFFLMFFTNTFSDVIRRGYYQELASLFRHAVLTLAGSVLILYMIKTAESYSRLIVIGTFLFYLPITYFTRLLWKNFLRKRMAGDGNRSLLILTTENLAADVVNNVRKHNYGRFHLSGLVLMDDAEGEESYSGIPVVASVDNLVGHVCEESIDEVLIVPEKPGEYPQFVYDDLTEAGITVHTTIAATKNVTGNRQLVENIGDYTVLTTAMNHASEVSLFFKRLFDIVAGLIGCIATGVIFLFIAPIIYFESPGPIFFSQERVGKNGKTFKMYKFRSMYPDAEERKKELIKENKLHDDKMFKLDFDPRVIGNKITADGKQKTGIGQFIRNTSLDEFPQFYNVLKGEMSVVGTRPPLPGEVSAYELHHRARLSIKPGITGLWQVSGRSDITDFEQVVKLDRKYINNWNTGLDLRILFKTVLVIFSRKGSS